MRSGFDELTLIEPHLIRLCIDMIQLRAPYLCRGIEVVINALLATLLTSKSIGH